MEFTQVPSNSQLCEHYNIKGQNICIGIDDYTNETRIHILKIFELLIDHYGFVTINILPCNASNHISNGNYSIWFQDGPGLFHVDYDDFLIAATKNVKDIIKVISNQYDDITYANYDICGYNIKIGNATPEVINNYITMIHHGFIANDDVLENEEHGCEFSYNAEYGFYSLSGYEDGSEYDVITSDFSDIIWYMNYEHGMYYNV